MNTPNTYPNGAEKQPIQQNYLAVHNRHRAQLIRDQARLKEFQLEAEALIMEILKEVHEEGSLIKLGGTARRYKDHSGETHHFEDANNYARAVHVDFDYYQVVGFDGCSGAQYVLIESPTGRFPERVKTVFLDLSGDGLQLEESDE